MEGAYKSAPKGIGGKDRTDRRDTWYSGGQDNPDTEEFDERYTPLGRLPRAVVVTCWSISRPPSAVAVNRLVQARELAGRADQVLFHELVHALRDILGLSNPVPTVNTSYLNEEEFLAIVEGIYVSAKGGTKFREGRRLFYKSHGVFIELRIIPLE
jgi:hypothetical protein